MKLICCCDDAANDTEETVTAPGANNKTKIKWSENDRFLFFKVHTENSTPSEFIKQAKKTQSSEETKSSNSNMALINIIKEARILGQLQHTNIVELLDSSPRQGSLTFRYYPFDLYFWLEDHHLHQEFVSKSSAGDICEGITSAIEYCHSKGIAHLDIKPENILLDLNLNPKVTDFELAMQLSHAEDDIKTIEVPMKPVGTYEYMSPLLTQAVLDSLAGKETNNKYNPLSADLFALGITLHQILGATFKLNVTPPFQQQPTISTNEKQSDSEISSRLNNFSDHQQTLTAITNDIFDNIGAKSWNLIWTLLQKNPRDRQNALWAQTQTIKVITTEMLDQQAKSGSGCCIS